MSRVIARRFLAVFAVLFGFLAYGGAASAQAPDRVIYGYQAPIDSVLAQPRVKYRAHARPHRAKTYAYHGGRKAKAYHAARRAVAQRRAKSRLLAARARSAPMVQQREIESAPARASGPVVARVDIAAQRMVVTVGGEVAHVWHVSTARKGYVTPRGSYGPQRMHVSYFSKKYYNSPMPYSIFFKGGYAVHGTGAIKALGRPASHGCIRLATGNARTLFNLIRANGVGKARIVIS